MMVRHCRYGRRCRSTPCSDHVKDSGHSLPPHLRARPVGFRPAAGHEHLSAALRKRPLWSAHSEDASRIPSRSIPLSRPKLPVKLGPSSVFGSRFWTLILRIQNLEGRMQVVRQRIEMSDQERVDPRAKASLSSSSEIGIGWHVPVAALHDPAYRAVLSHRSKYLFGKSNRLSVVLAIRHSDEMFDRRSIAATLSISESQVLDSTNFLESVGALVRTDVGRNVRFSVWPSVFWVWMEEEFDRLPWKKVRSSRRKSPTLDFQESN
jgi:hypothetical protein